MVGVTFRRPARTTHQTPDLQQPAVI